MSWTSPGGVAALGVAAALTLCALGTAHAGGGPLGIDHRLNFDDSGSGSAATSSSCRT